MIIYGAIPNYVTTYTTDVYPPLMGFGSQFGFPFRSPCSFSSSHHTSTWECTPTISPLHPVWNSYDYLSVFHQRIHQRIKLFKPRRNPFSGYILISSLFKTKKTQNLIRIDDRICPPRSSFPVQAAKPRRSAQLWGGGEDGQRKGRRRAIMKAVV